MALALPGDAQPVRVRDTFTAQKSAVAKLFDRPVPTIIGANVANVFGPMDGTETFIVVFRNALRAYVQNIQVASNAHGYKYHMKFGEVADAVALYTSIVVDNQGGDIWVNPSWLDNYNGGGVYTDAPHGPRLYPGIFRGIKYVWIDSPPANSTAAAGGIELVAGTAVLASDFFNLELWDYNDGNPFLATSVNALGGAVFAPGATIGVASVPRSGYYAVKVIAYNAGTNHTIQIGINTVSSACNYAAHLPLPQIVQNQTRVGAARVIGASGMISNRTPQAYRGGTIVAYQPPKGEHWTSYYFSSNIGGFYSVFRSISALNSARAFDGATGCYGFVKVEDQIELEYGLPFKFTDNQQVSSSSFPLDDTSFIIIAMQMPPLAQGSVAVPPQSLQYSFDFNVEYTTEDQWSDKENTTNLPEDWTAALVAVSSMEQFYENPIHWLAIRKTLGRLASIGGTILSAFPQTAFLAPVANGLSQWLASMH